MSAALVNPAVDPEVRATPRLAVAAGAAGMCFVGGSVAVSSVLAGSPLFAAQAIRYAVACALLLMFARIRSRTVLRPRGVEWLWLVGVTVSGLIVFNIALVRGSEHAEPAVLGVAVACVPLALSIGGAVFERRRPQPTLLAAAALVTAGAALVQGVGRSDAIGLAWAVLVLLCEAGFTLLAIPVLTRLGAWGVSVHTTWIAAVLFAVLGVGSDGIVSFGRLDLHDLYAIAYLAVGVTAVAFVLWYSCVGRLGAGRAGLLTSVAPIAAAAVGVVLGGPAPRMLVWAGIAVIVVGLVLGLRSSRAE